MIAKFKRNKKRNSKKDIFFSISLGILLILVISFLVVTNRKISQRRAELTARITALKQETGILEQKNKELKEKISEVGSEEYLEKTARDQLNMKAPGEEVIVITEEEGNKEEEEIEEEKNWLEKKWEEIKSVWKR